jgi:hypothetical protein
MPFQPSPSLPDYSKLTFMLNSSGVQKWNPAVYDILKNLIAAVQQSQDTIVNNAGDLIQNISSGGGTVSVDPAGALSGDGSAGSPLAVKVDNTTIQILTDKLSGIAVIQEVTFAISAAGIAAAGTGVLASPIAGVTSKLIAIVDWGYWMLKNANSWVNGASNLRARYTGTVVQAAANLPLGLNNTVAGNTGAISFGSTQGFSSLGTDILGKGIDVSCDAVISASGGAPAPSASGTLSISYLVIG